jgi:hypothetical protein
VVICSNSGEAARKGARVGSLNVARLAAVLKATVSAPKGINMTNMAKAKTHRAPVCQVIRQESRKTREISISGQTIIEVYKTNMDLLSL